MESQKPCMLANADMGGVKPMSSTMACTLKIRGGVRGRLLRKESRKGCAHSMGNERDSGREPRSDPVRVVYGIDQQGGKGGANYLKEVCPTILSDSHGTPHAVACIGVDLYNQALTGGGCRRL